MQWLVNEDTHVCISGRPTMDAACVTIGCPVPHFSHQKSACECPVCSCYVPSMHTSADPALRRAPQQNSQICQKLQTFTYIFPTFLYVTPVTRSFIVMLILPGRFTFRDKICQKIDLTRFKIIKCLWEGCNTYAILEFAKLRHDHGIAKCSLSQHSQKKQVEKKRHVSCKRIRNQGEELGVKPSGTV